MSAGGEINRQFLESQQRHLVYRESRMVNGLPTYYSLTPRDWPEIVIPPWEFADRLDYIEKWLRSIPPRQLERTGFENMESNHTLRPHMIVNPDDMGLLAVIVHEDTFHTSSKVPLEGDIASLMYYRQRFMNGVFTIYSKDPIPQLLQRYCGNSPEVLMESFIFKEFIEITSSDNWVYREFERNLPIGASLFIQCAKTFLDIDLVPVTRIEDINRAIQMLHWCEETPVLSTTAWALGGFIGEFIRMSICGRWVTDYDGQVLLVMDDYPRRTQRRMIISPVPVAFKLIREGRPNGFSDFYYSLIEQSRIPE